MTERRHPLKVAGADVEIVARLPDGHAVVVYLGRDSRRTTLRRAAWAHEIRCINRHLAEIKRLIAAVPLIDSIGAPIPSAITTEPPAARPGGFLHAHFAAPRED